MLYLHRPHHRHRTRSPEPVTFKHWHVANGRCSYTGCRVNGTLIHLTTSHEANTKGSDDTECPSLTVSLSHGVSPPGRGESGGLQRGSAAPVLYRLAGAQSEGGNLWPLALVPTGLLVIFRCPWSSCSPVWPCHVFRSMCSVPGRRSGASVLDSVLDFLILL